MSHAISVGAGEAGSGQWEAVEMEVEEDDSGILVMGLRDKLGRFEGETVLGIEV